MSSLRVAYENEDDAASLSSTRERRDLFKTQSAVALIAWHFLRPLFYYYFLRAGRNERINEENLRPREKRKTKEKKKKSRGKGSGRKWKEGESDR